MGCWGADGHLNLIPDDPYRKVIDLDPWVVAPSPIADTKTPGMPRAADDAIFQFPAGERCAHVRTKVVDGVIDALIKKDGNHPPSHGE